MLRTPAGRIQVEDGIAYRLWPVLSRLAQLYRATAARNVRLTVVVGSFGKSTTTRTVASALAAPLPKSVLANAWSSIALRLLRTKPTQEHAVIEVGIAAPGQMARYARMLRPDTVVVTSIGSEHQQTIGSLDAIRAEKARMVEALQRSGTAVLNGDDVHVMAMKERTQARVVTFGFDQACDVRATRVAMDWPEGTRFHVRAFDEEREARIRLIGRHMVYPALAAIAVACAHGL
jgi:UDP-N-acetylmuramoyl-tripeptide--D-alanyl-D-alanine ligase